MHLLPPASEFESFRGDAIAQVWLDPYGVRFAFESEKQLYAETRIVQVEPDGTVWTFDCQANLGAPVISHRLLYKRIVLVDRDELQLTFRIDDGSAITIHSELGSYKSGHLITSKEGFTVF